MNHWRLYRTEFEEILGLGLQNWRSFTDSLTIDSFTSPFVLVPGGRIAHQALKFLGQMCVGVGDSNQAKWGSQIEGLKIESFPELARKFPEATFVVCSSVFGYEIEKQLKELGVKRIMPYQVAVLAWPGVFANREYTGLGESLFDEVAYDRIADLSTRLGDDESRLVLWAKLLFYLKRERSYLTQIRSTFSRYFANDVVALYPNGERFVDVGAFDGDTLREWKLRGPSEFDYYIAFEPDSQAFSQLQLEASSDLRVHCEKFGLSDRSETVTFLQHGVADSTIIRSDSVSSIQTRIETLCLDEFLTSFGTPTQVKMDIEGAERMAIRGGLETLSQRRVRLSISAYHFPHDLWEIPLLLLSIRDRSRCFLRHYTNEIDDTVCYVLD